MDTITESDMAISMMSLGDVGVIHRFMSIEEQENKVLDVHFYRESQPKLYQ